MAKRSSSTKRTQRTPATVLESQMGHSVPTGPSPAHSVIYIDDVLSRNNQRLYRQHKTYYADLRLSGQRDTTSAIEVWVLKSNWYVLGALRMAKRMHDQAMKEERAVVTESNMARWYDFRIQPNWTAGAVQQLSPLGLHYNTLNLAEVDATGGERLYSVVNDRDGNSVEFTLSGTSAPASGRLNVFDEFDAAGNVQDQPTVWSGSAPYKELFPENVLDDGNVNALAGRGNEPPYNPTDHNQVWTKAGELISSPGGTQQLSTGVFAAPLGIVYLRGYQITTDGGVHDEGLTLEVLPGDYKGVMALDI